MNTPAADTPGSFEQLLRSGRFAVTAELNPPDSADPEEVFERVKPLAGICDAMNATDGSGANPRMSSVAVCALLAREGYPMVMQVSCRDRNRISIQGDVLGAAALGIRNVLCLTGDGVQAGDHPEAKPVFDLDSISLLGLVRTMRDESTLASGRKLTKPPNVFIGAAANPFAPPHDFRPLRLRKKIEAGAQFVQTQYCYDIELLERFMQRVRDMGLHERCFILIGVGPLASARSARWMRTNVPGVHIPDVVIKRLEGAQDQRAEGTQVCVEMIQQIHAIKGIAGVHIMAFKQEERVAGIIEAAGVRRNIGT